MKYFIAYTLRHPYGLIDVSALEVSLDRPITGTNDLKEIEEGIKSTIHEDNIVVKIINFQKFELPL